MEYRFGEEINKMLKELEELILAKYDSAGEVGVRVNLMPKSHNTMSQYEHIMDNHEVIARMHERLDELKSELEASTQRIEEAKAEGRVDDIDKESKISEKLEGFIAKLEEKIAKTKPTDAEIKIGMQNAHQDPRFVVIHEASPGMTKAYGKGIRTDAKDVERPTKPKSWTRNFEHYDKLIRNQGWTDRAGAKARGDIVEEEFAQDRPFGRTIGYHARIDTPGLLGRNEIVILLPATASPDQISNPKAGPYVYGIERCVGEEQDFHIGIATQAMLAAFVFKQLGYDVETIKKRLFPHNFFARYKNSCPNRMLYASILLNTKLKDNPDGCSLSDFTEQELADIKEYVPWEVFTNLVVDFFERDKYPEELRRKFIYDMADYDAYVADPQKYNYEERRKDRGISKDMFGKDGYEPMVVTEARKEAIKREYKKYKEENPNRE